MGASGAQFVMHMCIMWFAIMSARGGEHVCDECTNLMSADITGFRIIPH